MVESGIWPWIWGGRLKAVEMSAENLMVEVGNLDPSSPDPDLLQVDCDRMQNNLRRLRSIKEVHQGFLFSFL